MLYTGKGGVGKTTTAAAAAACAAERGRRTLVASADAAHSLGDVLERRLGAEPVEVAPRLEAVELNARVETARHWERIREYLVALLQHQGVDAVVADELALLPGVEELATLLAVERFAEAGHYESVVLDCAPSDATLRLLSLPDVAAGVLGWVLPALRSLAGVATPLARRLVTLPLPESRVVRDAEALLGGKLRALRARLSDSRTSVRLVVTPERMAIEEAHRTYTELALFELPCDAVILNQMLPFEAAAEPFFRGLGVRQVERHREIDARFAPLPVLAAPLRQQEPTGVKSLTEHGQSLFAELEPDAVLCDALRVRFSREGDESWVHLPLPGATADRLDVAVVDRDLVVTTGARRRVLELPPHFAGLRLSEARLESPWLVVGFAAPHGRG